jgi:hypothetical protein
LKFETFEELNRISSSTFSECKGTKNNEGKIIPVPQYVVNLFDHLGRLKSKYSVNLILSLISVMSLTVKETIRRKYSAFHPGLLAATGYILLYNIGYALPMILVLLLYLIARRGVDDYKDTMHEKAKLLNVRLTTWTLVGFGLFSMMDAGCYFYYWLCVNEREVFLRTRLAFSIFSRKHSILKTC